MKRFLITVAILSIQLGAVAEGLDMTKPDTTSASVIMTPELTDADKAEILKEVQASWGPLSEAVTPDTYKIYDQDGDVVFEENLRFDEFPSGELKDWIEKSEFLFHSSDTAVYKIF